MIFLKLSFCFNLASVEAGELVPQTTLNKFANPDDEWTFWEKMQISYKVNYIFLYILKKKKIINKETNLRHIYLDLLKVNQKSNYTNSDLRV